MIKKGEKNNEEEFDLESIIEDAVEDMPDDIEGVDADGDEDFDVNAAEEENGTEDASDEDPAKVEEEGDPNADPKPSDDAPEDSDEAAGEGAEGEESDAETKAEEWGEGEFDDHQKFSDENLKDRTKDRFDKVIARGKELEEKVTTLEQNYEQTSAEYKTFHDGILGGGLEPQEVTELIVIGESVKNGDISDNMWARAEEFFNNMQQVKGRRFNSKDPLESFDDLKEAVEFGDMTQAFAEELALQRGSQAVKSEMKQQQTQQQRAVQQQQQGDQQEILAQQSVISSMETAWESSDPLWKHKKAKVLAEFQAKAKEGLEKRLFSPQYLPTLLNHIYDSVSKSTNVTPKAPKPKLRHKGISTPNKDAKLDTDSDDWISDALGGMS